MTPETFAGYTPANGIISGSSSGVVSYTYYQLGAPASDSFTYQVSDGQGGSATGQVQMTFTTGGESSVTGTIYAESIFGNSADNVIVGSG